MKLKVVVAALILSTLPLLGAATFKSSLARDATSKYQLRKESAARAYASEMQQARQEYRRALERAMVDATKASDLDEANRLRVAMDLLDVPAETPSPAAEAEPESPQNDGANQDKTVALEFKEHRYMLVSVALTWDQAQAVCNAFGGHLAAITSVEEQVVVKRVADRQRVWIGGTDSSKEGQWRWVTGEPFGFSAWASQQPDNTNSREHHLSLNGDGQWDDAIVNNRWITGFICEWD